ncbi:hypothetical protein C8R44DRAFT_892990 [Mycena epipterygia]|nr:hypothetical protein C8R44DRAFT_892990 [Mycena epipterygia]
MSDRGLFTEYSTLPQLQKHSHAIVEGRKNHRPVGGTPAVPRAPTARAASRASVPTRTTTARQFTAPSTLRPTAPVPSDLRPRPAPAGRGSVPDHSHKSCFGCGGMGHIASNPICPRYNDSASSRPRVGAQHMLESYTEVDEEPEDIDNLDNLSVEAGGDLEGLWGGSQYNADELPDGSSDLGPDPNEAPDLDQLLGESQAKELRVGAMRQFFSIRVNPDTRDPDESQDPGSVLDLDSLTLNGVSPAAPLWSAATETAPPSLDPRSPEDASPSYAGLLVEFESTHGLGPFSDAQQLELWAINAVGLEEQARTTWRGLIQLQPLVVLGYSEGMLRTTAVNVERESHRFAQHLEDMSQAQQDCIALLSKRTVARDDLDRLSELPQGPYSSAPGLLVHAMELNRRLSREMEHNVLHLDHRAERLRIASRAIEEELTRRMLEREAYALSRAGGPGSQSPVRQTPPAEVLPLIDISPVSTPPRSPHVHPWQRVRLSPESSPSPASSPPSYPGSPHDSDEYYSPDESVNLSRVPGFSPPVNPDSGTHPTGPSLAAIRVLGSSSWSAGAFRSSTAMDFMS